MRVVGANYVGDVPVGGKVRLAFSTLGAGDQPAHLEGLTVYLLRLDRPEDTEVGLTCQASYHNFLGLNVVTVDTAAGQADGVYPAGSEWAVLASGTVGGEPVHLVPVGHFSVAARSAP